jgi:hypothetical protein
VLGWYTTGNPDSCEASGGWFGQKSVNGGLTSQIVRFGTARQVSYIITCTKGNQKVTATAIVRKKDSPQPPSIGVELTADPMLLQNGDTTTLLWKTSGNPHSCKAYDGWTGEKNASGGSESIDVFFGGANSKTYTIVCTKSISSSVPNYYPVSGSSSTSTITARDTVTVTRINPPQPTSITVSLEADPTSRQDGQDTTLRWTTTGSPTNCTASDGWTGAKNVNGGNQNVTVSFDPGSDEKTYTLTCSKSGVSDVRDSVTVQKELPKLSLKKAENCSGTQPARIELGNEGDRAQLTACDNSTPVSGVTWINTDSDCIEVSEKNSTTKYFTAKRDPSCISTVHIEKSGYENSDNVIIGVYDGGTDGEAPINIEGSQWKEVAP